MAQLPLTMLCSTKFGRYNKISVENVYNMFQSDGWMIDYAGYKSVETLMQNGVGRGLFFSSRSNTLYAVISQNIYSIVFNSTTMITNYVASLESNSGDVFIDENLKNQIAFCDKKDIYVYDYSTTAFSKLPLGFFAGYVTFQDNRFIATVNNQPQWQLSDFSILSIESATVVNGGSGYHVGDVLTVLNGGSFQGTLTVATLSGSAVATVTVSAPGSGYANGAIYSVSGGFGSAATFKIAITSGFAQSVTQVGSFQSKPDNALACVRVPGRTGQILIMGSDVTEVWTDLGLQLFPYQRNSGYVIDYGCLNPATIAASDDFIIWLGSNEKSGPVIMVCSGNGATQISTDGINYRLSTLINPEDSYGFIFKQGGQMFYQITFADPRDNVTYIYHFNAKVFYTLCDTNQNHHIARRALFFNNDYYFVSFNDGNLYQLSDQFDSNDGEEIPRIIITSPSALPDRSPFVVNSITFPIEQGMEGSDINTVVTEDIYLVDNDAYPDYIIDNDGDYLIDGETFSYVKNSLNCRVDLSVSSDGGVTFGKPKGIYLNKTGKRKNTFKSYSLGRYNEISFQFRFWGLNRFVLSDGIAEVN